MPITPHSCAQQHDRTASTMPTSLMAMTTHYISFPYYKNSRKPYIIIIIHPWCMLTLPPSLKPLPHAYTDHVWFGWFKHTFLLPTDFNDACTSPSLQPPARTLVCEHPRYLKSQGTPWPFLSSCIAYRVQVHIASSSPSTTPMNPSWPPNWTPMTITKS